MPRVEKMKSLDEARRQLESGEIKHRRARRQADVGKNWDDYTIATQKKKHKDFLKAVDSVVRDQSYTSTRDIHALYSVQSHLHSAATELLFDGDNAGRAYYDRAIRDFSNFLETLHLAYPLSDNYSQRSRLWSQVKGKVALGDKEKERMKLIETYNLDKNLSLLKARNAARKENAKLEKQAKAAAEEANRKRLGLNDDADLDLALRLEKRATLAMEKAEKGYLYFKCWVLPDDSQWYKIGVTNNPSRREAEQNVLPVPSHTLHIITLESTDHARYAEAAFHDVLDTEKIKGAGNRELFDLTPRQVQAVIAAMKQLETTPPVEAL